MAESDNDSGASRRDFVKKSVIGGAGMAAALGLIRMMPSVEAVTIGQGYPQLGGRQPPSPPGSLVNGAGWFVWYDSGQSNPYAARNLYSGVDEFRSASASAVINSAIGALASTDTTGAEIFLSADVNDPTGVVTINRNNISLVSMRKTGSRTSNGPRPHIQKISYVGPVRGGLLEGIHCREIAFNAVNGGMNPDNQQLMTLRDISMNPTGATNQQGLRFLGGGGYIQYINIHNLDINLGGASPIGVDFAVNNLGTGHITFSGHVNIEVDGATGSPVAFRIGTNAGIGTPIRIDNLSVIDFSAGAPVKTIYQVQQTTVGSPQGLAEMNIGRLFFGQHNTSAQPYLVTIDAAGAGAFDYFGLTIDELAVSEASASTVNIINNANTLWISREQFLRVNSGYKMGTGTLALGTPSQDTFFRVYLGKITGLTPTGPISTPFQNSPTRFVGMGGSSSTPDAGFDYIIGPTPIVVKATSNVEVRDPSGTLIKTVVNPSGEFVPLSYKVRFVSPASGVTIYGA